MELLTALNYATTHLEATYALVTMDTHLMLTIIPAMVRVIANISQSFLPFFLDINECIRGTSGCTQLCNNTLGSYICSCSSGYTIDADNHMCNGEGHITEFLSFILVLCRHQ